jgi:hypothetical protein
MLIWIPMVLGTGRNRVKFELLVSMKLSIISMSYYRKAR